MRKFIGSFILLLLALPVASFGQSPGVGQIWSAPNATLQNAATANGNGSTLGVQGLSGALVTVNCSVACTGGTTITFELSQDGTHYSAVSAQELGTTTFSSTVVNQGTTPTLWYLNVAGAEYLESPISSYSAGTITVTATAVGGSVFVGPLNVQGISGGTAIPVSGTFWQTTQPVSLSSLPALASGSNTIGAVTQASGPWTMNFTELDGTALGAPSDYGTSPGAVEVQGVNAYVTNTPTVDIASSQTIAVTQATASNLNATVAGSLSNNGAAATSNFLATLPGIAQTSPNNGTAATQGRNVALNVGTDGALWVNAQPALRPASYEASANFAASSTTDNACIYGNSTDTVVLYEVDVSGVQTTAGIVNVSLIRRSAAESGGTSTNMTAVRSDVTNYSAADTTPVYYTGTGPTAGTAVGNVDNKYTAFLSTSTATPADLYLWNGRLKPQVLIGSSQGVCVNLGNAALTGGEMSLTWRWLEISNISE